MPLCSAIISLCFAGFGIAKTLWQFYLLSAILGVLATGIAQIPISYIITNCFASKKKGMATGIAFSGGNLGAFFTILIISNLIHKIGYEKFYFILGGLMFVITTTVSLFVIKKSLSVIGQAPYGVNETSSNSTNTKHQELKGYTLSEAKNSPVFWTFIIAIILLGVVFAGVQMHIPSYMESIGHSPILASTITSIVSVFGIISNILIGLLLEKTSLKKVMSIIGLGMICSIIALLYNFCICIYFPFIYSHSSYGTILFN